MLSDEKHISQKVGVVHEELKIIFLLIGMMMAECEEYFIRELKIIFLLIGLKLVPANVVWVATSLISNMMMVAGVANQPRMIA